MNGCDKVPGWIKRDLKRAVKLIHHDDDYHGGMDIIARLAGLPVNRGTVKPCTVADLVHNANSDRADEGGSVQ